jgi:hypothetical protein
MNKNNIFYIIIYMPSQSNKEERFNLLQTKQSWLSKIRHPDKYKISSTNNLKKIISPLKIIQIHIKFYIIINIIQIIHINLQDTMLK